MAENHCIDCKYFVDHTQLGQCRRFPLYQARHRNEWCGEFWPQEVDITFQPKEVQVIPTAEPKRKPGRPKKNA